MKEIWYVVDGRGEVWRRSGLDEEVVGNDIELLLLVAGGVGGAGQTREIDQGCATDVVGNRLE